MQEDQVDKNLNTIKENDQGSILLPKISFNDVVPHRATSSVEHQQKPQVGKRKPKTWLKVLGLVLGVIVVVLLVMGFFGYRVYQKVLVLEASIKNVQGSVQEKDLEKVKSSIADTKTSLQDVESAYAPLVWMKVLPFVGGYVSDGQHAITAAKYGLDAGDTMIAIIEPYADIIGFKSGGQAPTSGLETAKDRLDFVIKTIPTLTSKSDDLISKVKVIHQEVDQINPNRYPEEIGGKKVREKIQNGIELVDSASTLIERSKPLLQEAPYIMGVNGPRTYLVLFQNDKELRPTGGFLTAYSIATVDHGKFQPVSSNDIYNLDAKYTPTIQAPDPFAKYLKGIYVASPKLRLRDINWSPDFSVSMDTFSKEAGTVGIKNIDGIIAVDTQLLVNLLNVTGPIGVSGFGNFSNDINPKCNCPEVIYQLESFADVEGPIVWDPNTGKIVFAPANIDNRKKIIGPLMNSVLANTMGQPKNKIPLLFDALLKSLTEKHVLFYMFDKDAQNAVKEFGIAGTVDSYNGDYLLINDANLGGRKSNLYVTQEVNQEINVALDGTITKTLTITYKNPEKQDGWLNSVLPDWLRVYVPKGSQLISSEGFVDKASPYDDLDKTVFAGYYSLRPQGVAVITLKYKLPFKATSNYNLLIQKQAGLDSPTYSVSVGRNSQEFFLKTDKELKFQL